MVPVTPAALYAHVHAGSGKKPADMLTDCVVADAADESRRIQVRGERGDVRRGSTARAIDLRLVIRPAPERASGPHDDVFNQVAHHSQHLCSCSLLLQYGQR